MLVRIDKEKDILLTQSQERLLTLVESELGIEPIFSKEIRDLKGQNIVLDKVEGINPRGMLRFLETVEESIENDKKLDPIIFYEIKEIGSRIDVEYKMGTGKLKMGSTLNWNEYVSFIDKRKVIIYIAILLKVLGSSSKFEIYFKEYDDVLAMSLLDAYNDIKKYFKTNPKYNKSFIDQCFNWNEEEKNKLEEKLLSWKFRSVEHLMNATSFEEI